MKRQSKWFVYPLLAAMMLATTLLGLPGPASAQTLEPLSSLTAGDTVNFAGHPWTVLNPSTGYLLMNDYYNDGTAYYFSSGSTNFSGSIIEGLLDTNANSFYNSLSPADRALIQDYPYWITTPVSTSGSVGTYSPVTDYIGLLSYYEWYTYSQYYGSATGGFLGNPGAGTDFWTLSPVSDYPGNIWLVDYDGTLNPTDPADPATGSAEKVRPALYLNPSTPLIYDGTVIPFDPATSSVAANPSSTTTNGRSTVTVTLKNSGGIPVSGVTVKLTSSSTSTSEIDGSTSASVTTNSSGVATFTVTNSTEKTVTYTATDTTDGVQVGTAQVQFVAPTPGTLAALSQGDNVNFAGYTWTVLDPSTGYLLMSGYYNNDSTFSNGSTNFSGSDIETLLDTSFYNSLSPADRALIQDQSWDTTAVDSNGNPSTTTSSVTDHIGLLSYNDWKTYSTYYNTTAGFLGNPSDSFWTLTPVSGGSQVWVIHTDGSLFNADNCIDTLAVRPALYLNPGILVSGGTVIPFDPVKSTVTASQSSVLANGSTTATITVTLEHSSGSGVSGVTVQLSPSSGRHTVITPPAGGSGGGSAGASASGTTNTSGVATFTVTDSTAENVTFTATDTTDNNVTVGTAQVQFVAAPAITSASSTTFTVGNAGSFTVTATGYPTPSLSDGGAALPSGVTFTDNGDGTATLAGTPNAGTDGSYTITITASNGVGSNATQSFTLTVGKATASFTASASPTSTSYGGTVQLSASGLPSGATGTVTFTVYDSTPGSSVIFSGTGMVASGSASCITGVLTTGSHAVTAAYSGDSNYQATTATTSFTVVPDHDATLSNLAVGGTTVVGFARNTYTYNVTLPAGTTTIPTVSATVYDSNATDQIHQATGLPGSATVLVTAQDNTTQLTYTINFSVAPPAQGLAVNPPGCTHTGPLPVTISDSSPLSVWQSVYYSTAGDPETVSGATYLNRSLLPYLFTLSVSDTVYARVYDISAGWGALTFEKYTIQTPAPVINAPVYAGATSVGGTATNNATVTLYDNGTQVGTAMASGSGTWTVSNLTLTAGDSLTATARVSGQLVSAASGAVTVSPAPAGPGDVGGPASFTPNVETEPASAITANSAVLKGDILSDNNSSIKDYGFLWGASDVNLTNKLDVGTDNHSGAFTGTLSNLTAGTTYYFRAYATNSMGTADGTVMSFAATSTTPTTTTTPTAPAFSDVSSAFWGYGAISSLSGQGYITGYPDGTFKPDNPITRAEFVSIMDKVLKLQAYDPEAPEFSDVLTADWYYNAVESSVYAGMVKGYGDNTFAPNKPVTREELACILVNALGQQDEAEADMSGKTNFTDDAGISAWARGFVAVAVRDGLLKGYPDGSFQPQGNATRAEACAMIENFLQLYSSGK